MRLAVIYNVFDGEELLKGSIEQIKEFASVVIAVCQTTSNHGNKYEGGYEECRRLKELGLIDYVAFVDPKGKSPTEKEKNKRNRGLDIARKYSCTHFLSMDCDEYYDKYEFSRAVEYCEDKDATYIPLYTYFGTPNFRLTPKEVYFVPFIAKLKINSTVGNHLFGGIWADPTRKPNAKPVLCPNIHMHHYSWIRKDIERKIDNSSANVNLKKDKDELIKATQNPKAGVQIPFYKGHKLTHTQDHFNINRILQPDIL